MRFAINTSGFSCIHSVSRLGAVGLLLGFCTISRANLVIAIWDGGIGDWENPGHWSTNPDYPNNTPTVQYDAHVGGGAATVLQSVTISALSLSGGSIIQVNGGPVFTVDGPMTW